MKRIIIIAAIATVITIIAGCSDEYGCEYRDCTFLSPVRVEEQSEEPELEDMLPDYLFHTDSIKWK